MYAVLITGLLLTALGNGPSGQRTAEPVVEEQPLEAPTFAIVHTNDTRGFLEGCG